MRCCSSERELRNSLIFRRRAESILFVTRSRSLGGVDSLLCDRGPLRCCWIRERPPGRCGRDTALRPTPPGKKKKKATLNLTMLKLVPYCHCLNSQNKQNRSCNLIYQTLLKTNSILNTCFVDRASRNRLCPQPSLWGGRWSPRAGQRWKWVLWRGHILIVFWIKGAITSPSLFVWYLVPVWIRMPRSWSALDTAFIFVLILKFVPVVLFVLLQGWCSRSFLCASMGMAMYAPVIFNWILCFFRIHDFTLGRFTRRQRKKQKRSEFQFNRNTSLKTL